MMCVNEKLRQLSVELPIAPPPAGSYTAVSAFGDRYLYTSGTGCSLGGKPIFIGRLGAEVSVEQGKLAARQCILNILSNVQAFTGDLNRIEKVVKSTVFVAGENDFHQQSEVANGATDLLTELFGENGKGARCAIGVSSLPKKQPVEIEIIFEIKPSL